MAPGLVPVALLVRSSHERWDEGGYPDRLTGDGIPLGARIVAVCDAFDAMISERPYSPAKTPEAALKELDRVAGTQFDPAVVRVFKSAWEEHSVALARAAQEAALANSNNGRNGSAAVLKRGRAATPPGLY